MLCEYFMGMVRLARVHFLDSLYLPFFSYIFLIAKVFAIIGFCVRRAAYRVSAQPFSTAGASRGLGYGRSPA